MRPASHSREGANMKHRIVTAAQMKEIERAGDAHGLSYLLQSSIGMLLVFPVTI